MLCALRDANVDFILVGAYALAAHGFPRATLDIDLWVKPSPANARQVMTALKVFGAPTANFEEADFAKEDMVVQIGVAPRRIDLITSVTGIQFADAAKNAAVRDIDGITVSVLSVEDMIRNKLATGRTKDLADAELLQKQFRPGRQS